MKKIISVLIVTIIATLNISLDVKAADMSTIATTAGAGAAALETGAIAYDASVVTRMAGRAGAAAPTGAKGIAFEILYADKSNIENVIKNLGKGLKTVQTNSSTAQTIDLITMDNTGKIVERIQCKDTASASGTKQVIDAVKSGKYNSAQLVGTSEAAEAFNTKAAVEGLSKVMKDSGISSKAGQSIADKALGNVTKAGYIAKSVGKSAVAGGGLSGGFVLVESLVNGDDAYHTASNVTIESAVGATAFGTADLIGCTCAEALAAIGAGTGVITVVPVVVVIGSSVALMYVMERQIDERDYKELLATNIQETCETSAEAVCLLEERIGERIEEADIKSIPEKIEDTCVTAAEAICLAEEEVGSFFTDTAKKIAKK